MYPHVNVTGHLSVLEPSNTEHNTAPAFLPCCQTQLFQSALRFHVTVWLCGLRIQPFTKGYPLLLFRLIFTVTVWSGVSRWLNDFSRKELLFSVSF